MTFFGGMGQAVHRLFMLYYAASGHMIRTLASVVLILLASCLFWENLQGLPYWLSSIGFLSWLARFDPLDKWLPALLTMLIAAYAVFHETLLSWFRRPKLTIDGNLSSIAIPVLFSNGRTANSYQVRLIIRNSGKHRAESVEVYAKQLSYAEVGGEWHPCDWFLPMNLKWANEEVTYMGISKGIERTCNLFGVMDPANADRPSLPLLRQPQGFDYNTMYTCRVQAIVNTSSYSNWLFPAAYRLDLIIAAANAETQTASVSLSFDGRWSDNFGEMLSTSIRASLISNRAK